MKWIVKNQNNKINNKYIEESWRFINKHSIFNMLRCDFPKKFQYVIDVTVRVSHVMQVIW